jgi:hypothetical protein
MGRFQQLAGAFSGASTELPRIEPGVRLHRDGNRHWSVRRDGDVRAVYDWDDLRLSISWKAWCFADEHEMRINEDHSDDLTLERILDTLVEDLLARGTVARRPDDETLAQIILDEYIRFPDESVGAS